MGRLIVKWFQFIYSAINKVLHFEKPFPGNRTEGIKTLYT